MRSMPTLAFTTRLVLLLAVMATSNVVSAGEPEFHVSIEAARKVLDQYVAKPDSAYQWKVRRSGKVGPTEYAELIMTSQIWRDIPWKHQLFLLKPSKVREGNRHALLLIAGGSWRDHYEDPAGESESIPGDARRLAQLAEIMQTPVAILLQVPRQPMFDGKHEDEIISYTFDRFVKTGETSWPLLLPMVKSAVRAMDTAEAYCEQEWKLPVDTFTVTGASKRGWTTWLTGAVDRRATAIAPMVIDVLNMKVHLDWQLKAWGKYSEQISDYTERGIPDLMNSRPGTVLREIVDPYSYRERYQQPKLMLIGTNDRYWPVDALNLYWKDLPGPKYVLYVPNNGHGLNDFVRVLGTINALHQHAAREFELPQLKWSSKNGGDRISLNVTSDKKPDLVSAWVATSPTRDFRQAKWRSHTMKKNGDGFAFATDIPEQGYLAIFGEAAYRDLGTPYFFSTTLQVVQRKN